MSRIIVKNIPKDITEYDLQEHFSTKGDVTDVKIMKTQGGKPRLFAFLGFKDEEHGKSCIKYFNKTYLKTNKIIIEEAKVQGDKSLTKPWSKHTKWADNRKLIKEKAGSVGKVNSNSSNIVVKENTKDKVKKLKEIEKVTSTKYKFDVVQGFEAGKDNKANKDKENLQLNEDRESNENNEDHEEKQNKRRSKRSENDKDPDNTDKTAKSAKTSSEQDLDEYDPKRLYLRNLSFQVTEDDIQSLFSKYGTLSEVCLPRDKNKNSFGYGFVCYETTESAILALEKMDKRIFQGRIVHITPAKAKDAKPSLKIDDLTKTQLKNNKTSFKKDKLLKLKSDYDKEVSWNFLFLNHNAVVDAVARQTGVDKQDLLSKDNAKLAVEVASMETIMISRTKEWLESQGIDLTPFNNKRLSCSRSKTIILIKNIDTGIREEELKKVFSRFGELVQFMLSPHNIMGIAEFIDAKNAENCFKNLSFFEMNGNPLYLEYAPVGVKLKSSKDNTNAKDNDTNDSNEAKENDKDQEKDITFDEGNILFVNNLSFDTKEPALSSFFSKFQPVSVKIIKNKAKNNPDLSAGYGFVEFKSQDQANDALKKLQGALLDSHSLKLSIAKSRTNSKEKDRKEQELLSHKRKKDTELADINLEDFHDAKEDKLLVKNIAFEATRDELRELFKQFGDVKNVRLPNKSTGEHRGYAFVEFLTHDEAKGAFNKLANTHFYGRKLVIEWAKKDKSIEELRNETLKKVQVFNLDSKTGVKDKRTINLK